MKVLRFLTTICLFVFAACVQNNNNCAAEIPFDVLVAIPRKTMFSDILKKNGSASYQSGTYGINGYLFDDDGLAGFQKPTSILATLTVIAAFLGFYYLRAKRLRQEFELRQQMSYDLHDNLSTKVYLMCSLANKIAIPLKPEAERQADLEKFNAISQEVSLSLRNFIWSIDPKQDKVSHLFDRLEGFAENYLSPLIPEVEVNQMPVPEHLKVTPYLKHNLTCLYQELLTNMVKHTQAQHINITLGLEKNRLLVCIQNCHKGVTPPSQLDKEARFGSETIQHRTKNIGATFIWIKQDEVQKVHLSVPL